MKPAVLGFVWETEMSQYWDEAHRYVCWSVTVPQGRIELWNDNWCGRGKKPHTHKKTPKSQRSHEVQKLTKNCVLECWCVCWHTWEKQVGDHLRPNGSSDLTTKGKPQYPHDRETWEDTECTSDPFWRKSWCGIQVLQETISLTADHRRTGRRVWRAVPHFKGYFPGPSYAS